MKNDKIAVKDNSLIMEKVKTDQLKRISNATIRRLSLYFRELDILEKRGYEIVSSEHLGMNYDILGSQLRRDLSVFGAFGKKGKGYNVSFLKTEITKILGLDKEWNIILIGSVQFSNVITKSLIFKKKRLTLTKLFDKSPEVIGKKINDITVSDIDNLEKEIDPVTDKVAIVALSPPEIQKVIDRLGKIGVEGVFYFASRNVRIPKNMVVLNADISVELGTLTYHINNKRHFKK